MIESDSNIGKKPKFDTSSASGIAKLLMLFMWVLIKKTLRLILKLIILFFYNIYKGVKRFIIWWQDGDTQAKRTEIWKAIKKACIKLCGWIAIGAIILWRTFVWMIKKIGHGIIHLRSTIIYISKCIASWFRKIREKDFKAIFRENCAKMKKALADFVTEKDEETGENKESEEELLREMIAKKRSNNAFENAIERFTRYL